MKKEKKEKHFIKKPTYEGGLTAMRDFIRKNMKYPKAALKDKIEGTVVVKYTVDHKGNVIGTKVVSKLGSGCDAEAKRLVSLFKFQVPKVRKMRIQYHKSIQIHFKVPKQKKVVKKEANKGMQITYTTTNTKKLTPVKKDNGNNTGGSYNYTISY